MPGLSGADRKYLRGLAHSTRPVAQLGKAGLSAAFLAEVDAALLSHELVKVRLAGDRAEREGLGRRLEELLGAEMVGLIGFVVILFRRHPDPEKRRISLP